MTIGVAQPQQERSRKSFARVREAALGLLLERGNADFTLTDVSVMANVSVGSIYGRVGSKAALLRLVEGEELDRVDAELLAEMRAALDLDVSLELSVRAVIAAVVRPLVRNAALIRACMTLADSRGLASGELEQRVFRDGLASVADRHGIDASSATLNWCHEVVYSITARHLGFGLTAGGQPGDVLSTELLEQLLAETVCLILHGAASRG